MAQVRWGILGTARIAERRVVPALQQGEHSLVTAVASRELGRAERFAKALDIPAALGTYEELLARTDVDAVYIPLPNHLHVPWSVRALHAGKHVLCEKPVALSGAEARVLRDVSRALPDLRVMEAFMYRFHPQWERVRQLIGDGAIGDLRLVESCFSFFTDDPTDIRNAREMGGGALMDIGCYGISVARWLFGAEPVRVMGSMDHDPRFGTDRLTTAVLEFEEGMATVTVGTQLAAQQRVLVHGTTGRIEVERPFTGPAELPRRLLLHRGDSADEIFVAPSDQFGCQGEMFARSVLHGTAVATPLEDAVANMDVVDAVAESARESAWVLPCTLACR